MINFLNLLFPRRCVSCGKLGSYFCKNCIPYLKTIQTTICPVCTKLSPFGFTHPGCKTRYSLDGLTSIFRYTGPIQKGIKMIKYRRVTDLIPELSTLIITHLEYPSTSAYSSFLKTKPVIVPIPLHWLRQRRRGFNQSELIAKDLAKEWELTICPDVLVRRKLTPSQAGLKKTERKMNIKSAFQVSPKKKEQLSTINNALLFDDVWTTGSTMREAANALKRAGVKKVWALTIAR
ncbi:MAG: ComF family protein [Candidatus Roizmanbacteria bacterium]|nr:ComF family protein [Candidatus Roizmanbacteria bacterium]